MINLAFDMSLAKTTTIATLFFDSVGLKNGNNFVSERELQILRSHPDYVKLKNRGAFAIAP